MMTTAVAIPVHQFHHHHPRQPITTSSRTTSMPGSSRPQLSSATAAPPITTISQRAADPSTPRFVGNAMHPPPQLRSRTSTTTITRPVSPPIPPSLIDSPYIQDPNSPFRRDYTHSHSPAGPSYNTGHDRLNLLDTVPMGEDPKKYLELRRGSLEPAELPPDDIGVAGAPKSARTSDMTTIRSTRPGINRGNSWQRAGSGSAGAGVVVGSYPPHPTYPSISPSQSTVKLPTSLPPQRFPPSNALPPISTPLPVPTRYQQQQQPPAGSSLAASPNAASKGPSPGSTAISAATR